MTGRNRRASLRVRLAVAAAVLVGGGAAAVVGVAASNGGAATAQSAGYSTHMGRTMSYTSAMSSAMRSMHHHATGNALMTMSHMKPMRTYTAVSWHRTTLALQRGTVLAVNRRQLVVQSTNGIVEIWRLNGHTWSINIGGNATGMSAMGGGTMRMPRHMNMRTRGLAKGDTVYVFGEKQHRTLKAQLVLFAAPMAAMPTATPSMTATPAPTATPATANTRRTNAPQFSGNNS